MTRKAKALRVFQFKSKLFAECEYLSGKLSFVSRNSEYKILFCNVILAEVINFSEEGEKLVIIS